jgi:hypothetical protein
VLALESASALLLLAGLVRERLDVGIQSDLFALACALLPFHLARGLAWAGRAPAPPTWLQLLELGSLAGLAWREPPGWAFSLAGVAALALGLHALTSPGEARGSSVLARFALACAIGAVLVRWARGEPLALACLLPLGMTLAEGLQPRGGVAQGDGLRRLAIACAILGPALSRACGALTLIALAVPATQIAWLALVHGRTPPAERARRLRRAVARASLSAAACALALGGLELGLRLAPNRYRDVVLPTEQPFHVPGAVYRYEGPPFGPRVPPDLRVELRWNSAGWHDVDHAAQKPPGRLRVLVLGDSYVEGLMVPTESLYHRQLERLLAASSGGREVEVIGIGHSSWGQAEELACLEREGLGYEPDLVLVEFLPSNDVRNNLPELERAAQDDYWGTTPARRLYVSALEAGCLSLALVGDKADLLLRALRGHRDPIDVGVYQLSPRVRPDLWTAAWERTEALLRRVQGVLGDVPLAVVVFTIPAEIEACTPDPPPTAEGADMTLPARRMRELCARLGVPCLDLAPRFARLPAERRAELHLLPWDGHWGAAGHAAAAEETAQFLTRETSLWRELTARDLRRSE